jgi:hypothetical protein
VFDSAGVYDAQTEVSRRGFLAAASAASAAAGALAWGESSAQAAAFEEG